MSEDIKPVEPEVKAKKPKAQAEAPAEVVAEVVTKGKRTEKVEHPAGDYTIVHN